MTEIAEYIMAPLNTATGVINRLEKKQMIDRIRSEQDRRIVLITLTDKAKELIDKEKDIIIKYFNRIHETLTEEEIASIMSVFGKLIGIFSKDKETMNTELVKGEKIKKISIE